MTFFDGKTHDYERQNLLKYVSIKFIFIDYRYYLQPNGEVIPNRTFTDLGSAPCTSDRF